MAFLTSTYPSTAHSLRKPMTEINKLGLRYRAIQQKEWMLCAYYWAAEGLYSQGDTDISDPVIQAQGGNLRNELLDVQYQIGVLQLDSVSLTLDLCENPSTFIRHDEAEYWGRVGKEIKRLKLELLECEKRLGNLQVGFEMVFRMDGFHWSKCMVQDNVELFINSYKAEAWVAPRDEDN